MGKRSRWGAFVPFPVSVAHSMVNSGIAQNPPTAPGDFDGLRVAIFGCATGIGRAVAEAFVAVGAQVAMADIDPSIEATAQSVGAASFHVGDIGTLDQPGRMVAEAAQALSGLDCLVNVAGIQIVGMVADTSPAAWDRLMAVNLRGPFLTCQAALPWLEHSSRGAVVNTASIAAQRGGPGGAAYAASKGGLQTFSGTLTVEWAPKGITVNTVCPGYVDTGFNAPGIALMGGQEKSDELVRQTVRLGRQATPKDIAPAYVFLASSGARYLTGKSIVIDGGIYP